LGGRGKGDCHFRRFEHLAKKLLGGEGRKTVFRESVSIVKSRFRPQ